MTWEGVLVRVLFSTAVLGLVGAWLKKEGVTAVSFPLILVGFIAVAPELADPA